MSATLVERNRSDSAPWLLLMQRPRNPCRGLRTACDRRTRSEQLHGRGAAGPRAGDSREDRFEKSAFLVEHEQWRYCSIPAYARDQHQQPRAARLPTISGVRCFAEYWGARGCSRNIYVMWVIISGHIGRRWRPSPLPYAIIPASCAH